MTESGRAKAGFFTSFRMTNWGERGILHIVQNDKLGPTRDSSHRSG
jgi:hypothetical protein